ncbi:unnamed protein product, partial [Mesorhabditis belari]|uniref:Uncharacterized protein n=1 Tax=Mesorhabditis belari TaxID=2138241 RepID=A0AAF3EKC9_9BILA
MLNLRHAFHPFFSFYFTSLLFLYIACMSAAYVVEYALMAQALISLLCIFILYFVNLHRTKKLTKCGGGELTLRYQLAENIKAMKTLIPFLLLDNMITWNDQLFDLLFEVNYLQPPILCTKSTNNLLFLISTTSTWSKTFYALIMQSTYEWQLIALIQKIMELF